MSSEGGSPTLVEVRRLPEEAALLLSWSDGFVAKPSYRLLAGWCPCAGCQGHGGQRVYREPKGAVDLLSVEPVGNYAISLAWRGGCQTGIYSYDYLRQLCSQLAQDSERHPRSS